MNFTMFATYVLVAVVTGLTAGSVIRNRGHGRAGDVLLALIGSGVACSITVALGLLADSDAVAIAILTLVAGAGTIATQRAMEA